MRVGTDGEPQWVDIPVQAHRWIPPGSDITHVRLSVKRTAARRTAQVLVAVRVPQQRVNTTERATAVAVHRGWRQTESGIRVASWRATAPLRVPAGLDSVILSHDDGVTGQILIPPTITNRLDHAGGISAQRGESLSTVRSELAAWLKQHGPVQHQDRSLAVTNVSQWRSPAQFAALAKAWRSEDSALGAIGGVLEAWRKVDARLWDRQEHGHRRALGYRDDLYRQVAAAIADQACVVVVDDMDLSAIARTTRSSMTSPGRCWPALCGASGRLLGGCGRPSWVLRGAAVFGVSRCRPRVWPVFMPTVGTRTPLMSGMPRPR